LVTERAAMKRVLDSKIAAWPMWEVAAQVWADGGSITSLAFREGEIVVNGRAGSAIKVLEGLSRRKEVASARFDAAVRQSQGLEEFVIRLRVKSEIESGSGS
jgi:hypothetical protein